jgi:hypothetical protein
MHTYHRNLGIAGRTAAIAAFLTGAACFTYAQQPAPPQQATLLTSAAAGGQAGVLLAAAESPALNLSAPEASSSSSISADSLLDARLNLSSAAMDAAQPPPRRRYGRPNYSDSHTNPDGSSKFAFMAGVGASIPVADTGNYLSTSYAFQVGAGRNFNKNVGVLFQFDYDHFGFTNSTLNNQSNLYYGATAATVGLGGTSHIWSFTLDPTFTFYDHGKTGAYVVGGVGFYHKVADFTVPSTGTYCDYFYGCYQYQANSVIDDYTSNAFGLNGGVGLTYKPSRFASERIFLEARYVFMDNSPRAASSTNLYPPNANQTYYIPVTVGLRF